MKGEQVNSKFYKKAFETIENGNSYLLTVTQGPRIGQKLIIKKGELLPQNNDMLPFWEEFVPYINWEKIPYHDFENNIFVESLSQEVQIVMCGGGHVSYALSKLTDFLGYHITVIDDREEFANKERFPNAKRIICKSFAKAFETENFSADSCFVIVTRGHVDDALCLEEVMKRDYRYAGMIGSRSKIGKCRDLILSKGFSSEEFNRVHTPIGLDIGGQTPEEIAISIIAQIIQELNKHSYSTHVDREIIETIKNHPEQRYVLAKIVSKKGSSPRGVGAQILVKNDSSIIGTIGGGKIEHSVITLATQLLNQKIPKPTRQQYALNTKEARALGMWCGGDLEIFFDIIEEGI